MRCRFCGTDPNPVILVPNKEKAKDGMIEIFSCLDCAIKQGIYCQKHESPHTGFLGDSTTACLRCIEEEVQAIKEMVADEVYERLHGGLAREDWGDLEEAAKDSSILTGDDEAVSILRFVVTSAHRLQITWEDVVARILRDKSAELLLPSGLF